MTIRNWIKFFMVSMIIGGGVTAVSSLFIRWNFFQPYITSGQIGEFIAAFIWMILLGFTMSVIAQAGFFTYLTIHQVGVGLFRSLTLWNWVQVVLIVVVLVDIVIFRFAPDARTFGDWAFYLGLLVILVGAAILTALKKVKMTGKKHVLVSALFFMIVVTSLEWIIALMGRDENINTWLALILLPLVAVNAFQLLMLPKYNKQSAVDLAKREERRKERKRMAQQQS